MLSLTTLSSVGRLVWFHIVRRMCGCTRYCVLELEFDVPRTQYLPDTVGLGLEKSIQGLVSVRFAAIRERATVVVKMCRWSVVEGPRWKPA